MFHLPPPSALLVQLEESRESKAQLMARMLSLSSTLQSWSLGPFDDGQAPLDASYDPPGASNSSCEIRAVSRRLDFVRRLRYRMEQRLELSRLSRSLADPAGADGGVAARSLLWTSLCRRQLDGLCPVDLSLLVEPVVQPVVARFRFHFFAAESKLNRLDRPDWMFARVVAVVVECAPVLLDGLQPVLDAHCIDAFTVDLFIRSLLPLVGRRVSLSCRQLLFSSAASSNVVDADSGDDGSSDQEASRDLAVSRLLRECLLFDGQLESLFGFSEHPMALLVAGSAELADAFVRGERALASRRFRDILVPPQRCLDLIGEGVVRVAFAVADIVESVSDVSARFAHGRLNDRHVVVRDALLEVQLDLLDRFLDLMSGDDDFAWDGGSTSLSGREMVLLRKLLACDFVGRVLLSWLKLPSFYAGCDGAFASTVDGYQLAVKSLVNRLVTLFRSRLRSFSFPAPPVSISDGASGHIPVSSHTARCLVWMHSYLQSCSDELASSHALFHVLFQQISRTLAYEWGRAILSRMYRMPDAQQLQVDIVNGLFVMLKAFASGASPTSPGNGHLDEELEKLNDYVNVLLHGDQIDHSLSKDVARTLVNLRVDDNS